MRPERFSNLVHVLDLSLEEISAQSKAVDLEPGSDEWLEYRRDRFNGSEAPVMMALSKNEKRSDLLVRMATGHDKEFSDFVRDRIFSKGHDVEEKERARAGDVCLADFSPAIFECGVLSSSLDGFDPDRLMAWECKQWSKKKSEEIAEGNCPFDDFVQVQQGLLLSGAVSTLYTLSDGEDQRLDLIVEPDPDFQAAILSHWKQFWADLQEIELDPFADPEPVKVGELIDRGSLVPLDVQVTGEVISSNLDVYRESAIALFDGMSTDLKTDEDFVEAKDTIKWIKDIENDIKKAEDNVLNQTGSVRDIVETLRGVGETARQKRLAYSRLVDARQKEIRAEIVEEAGLKFEGFCRDQEKDLQILGRKFVLKIPAPDFSGSMKNKSNLSSIRGAVDDCLAASKILASEVATNIRSNLNWLSAVDDFSEVQGLFADLDQFVDNGEEAFRLKCEQRIREEHDRRAEAEKKRLAEEEASKTKTKAEDETQDPPEVETYPEGVEIAPASPSPRGTGKKASKQTDEWSIQVEVVRDLVTGKQVSDALNLVDGVTILSIKRKTP